MRENQKRQNPDSPSEHLEQSDASGKTFYQTPEEFRRDNSNNPQKGDRISVSKTNERDTETDEYRDSKLSDTEIGGE
jgi:hypothetical protein